LNLAYDCIRTRYNPPTLYLFLDEKKVWISQQN